MNGRVLILRHGHTKLNAGGETSVDKIRGWSDIPLDASGVREAHQLAQKVADWPITLVITSDLQRSIQTGKQVARQQGVKLTPTKAFRPMDVGVLTGTDSKEAQPYLEQYASEKPGTPIPDGESFDSFKERAIPALRRLLETVKATKSTVAVVTHFRTIKLIEGWLAAGGNAKNDVHLPTFFKNDLLPAAIVELVPRDGRWAYRVLDKGAAD